MARSLSQRDEGFQGLAVREAAGPSSFKYRVQIQEGKIELHAQE